MKKFEGLIAAPFTPMDENGDVMPELIPGYLDFLERNGVAGVFINGSTGEGVSLSQRERRETTEAWTSAAKGKSVKVISLVGGTSYKDSIDSAQHAFSAGVDAIAIMAPYYFKPPTAVELVEFCRLVAASVPELPVYFYHIPVSLLFFLLGSGLYAFYISNPGQLGVVNPNIDSVFPQFIVSQMPSGLSGLLIAAIFAAAMSTLSSNINSVSAVVTADFFKILWPTASSAKSMLVARWSGIVIGLFGIGMALVLATWNIASLWDQFNTFLGLLTGGLGALFVMGIFFKRIGGTAALGGVAGGLIVLLLVKNHSDLSFLMYGFTGMFSSVVLALVLSLVFPNREKIQGYTWQSISKNTN